MSAEDELQEVQEQLQGYGNKLPPFDTLSLYLRIVRLHKKKQKVALPRSQWS